MMVSVLSWLFVWLICCIWLILVVLNRSWCCGCRSWMWMRSWIVLVVILLRFDVCLSSVSWLVVVWIFCCRSLIVKLICWV